MMQFAEFKTSDPLSDLSRVLDEIARVGFTLNSLSVDAEGVEAEVRIGFRAGGNVSVDTFLARIEKMPNVRSVLRTSSTAVAEAA